MTVASCNRMDGKICVVTGATQGLGAAIARRLAAAGAAGIVVTGRNGERGAHVAREIAETHGIWAHFLQRLLHLIELERLDDRLDLLHAPRLPLRWAGSVLIGRSRLKHFRQAVTID